MMQRLTVRSLKINTALSFPFFQGNPGNPGVPGITGKPGKQGDTGNPVCMTLQGTN